VVHNFGNVSNMEIPSDFLRNIEGNEKFDIIRSDSKI
jgi:hypothetical protein